MVVTRSGAQSLYPTNRAEVDGDMYESLTLQVASMFIHVFPLRCGSVEVMKVQEIYLNVNSTDILSRYQRSLRIDDGFAIYKHDDPKNGRPYYRAYPLFVHHIMLYYINCVRIKMKHDDDFKFVFALERNKEITDIAKKCSFVRRE